MGENRESTNGETALLARDTGLALVRVTGRDATAFLDAQTTTALDENTPAIRFSALADPKGRVLIVFHAWPEDGGWTLALAKSEAEWLAAHLKRFVFRAQVRIAPQPDSVVAGVAGANAAASLAAAGYPVPATGLVATVGALKIAGLFNGRWLVAGEKAAFAKAARAIERHTKPADENAWKQGRLAAGEVEIRAETRGRFLPQMLGLVELDAVSFSKGCYPGQEVIARLQHRGQVKRKLALFKLDVTSEAGSRIKVAGTPVEVLDSACLRDGSAIVQAVAPYPLPPALTAHLHTIEE